MSPHASPYAALCLAQTSSSEGAHSGLTPGGWIFMIASICFVLALTGFCYARVLRKSAAAEHMQAPLEIDTHDRE